MSPRRTLPTGILAALVLAAPAAGAQTVGSIAARRVCSTSGIEGISSQLVTTQLCRQPGVFARVTPHANVTLTSARVHPLMLATARDALWRASRSLNLQVTSMFRTLADQYVLYHSGACGLAARPGASNHQSGRAVDLSNWSSARSAMARAGCSHPYPGSDDVHFDCPGSDRRVESVRSFQRLWNVNHASDRIAEDGLYGPATASRLSRSPARGFSRNGCVADGDGDGVVDDRDNCPREANRTQADRDRDGRGDVCDNCAAEANRTQADADRDGVGDACDNCARADNRTQTDADRDGLGDACDNCPRAANATQPDLDRDRAGDACDADDDGDAVADATDNCPRMANRDQADRNRDGMGDACDGDDDGDGVADGTDNCRQVANPAQADRDRDGAGDACDDGDGDMVLDAADNCPAAANRDQGDLDRDGAGDACDADADGDAVADATDNCRGLDNRDQADLDRDALGDACDGDDDGDGVPDAMDNCPRTANADQLDTDDDGEGDACDAPPTPRPEPDGGMMNPDPMWDGGGPDDASVGDASADDAGPTLDGDLEAELPDGGCACRAGGAVNGGGRARGGWLALAAAALLGLSRRSRGGSGTSSGRR